MGVRWDSVYRMFNGDKRIYIDLFFILIKIKESRFWIKWKFGKWDKKKDGL